MDKLVDKDGQWSVDVPGILVMDSDNPEICIGIIVFEPKGKQEENDDHG